ncbi:MAG: molybdopterin-dependent oxidoreductase [Ignavibacteria bacterium]|nr:molybdopterin-dependent oxidoreductase [Ignavibacteria bacterium]
MINTDAIFHVKGESQFIDDRLTPEGTLYAAVFTSPVAHGKIIKINTAPLKRIEGVVKVITASDIPGENQIGNIIQDEVLLAEDEVHYIGQPIAIVVGTKPEIVRKAVKLIRAKVEVLPPVFNPREAFKKGHLITPTRTFSLGDVNKTWKECDLIVEGTVESGGQEHVYLETQGAFSYPTEKNTIKVISSTQAPSTVQKIVARVLDLPIRMIEVDVLRIGGGFGGKEDQAVSWAAMTALASYKLKKPVKLVLRRKEDILMTGKRHPYSSDFKMGLKRNGKILAYENTFYQNAGASADLSTAIMERSLFHATNSYYIPNAKINCASCRTNFPPNTAFRGFGAPQAMFVIESAIFKAADELGVDPTVIQKKNLLKKGDVFPYGMKLQDGKMRKCWEVAGEKYKVEKIKERINKFNSNNKIYKKGISIMPICFGISFTSSFLNQASALVHIYTDGSVSVSTAAIEMGQGVNTKIRQVAAKVLSINIDRVEVLSTKTSRVANTSPTAASTGADLNGNATKVACKNLMERLRKVASDYLKVISAKDIQIIDEEVYIKGRKTGLKWDELVNKAYMNRVSLSAQAHYVTPNIFFDRNIEKGKPFAYHVFGIAVTEVTIDCLRGIYEIDSVKVVHDAGKSFNLLIDRGQMEGGIVQGIGWATIEELMYGDDGKLLTDSLATYKIPDIYFAPKDIKVHFLKDSNSLSGILKSKAIGEPPFLYGIGTYFALIKAIREFRLDLKVNFSIPITPEKVLLSLYEKI